ncbi:MAG: hypothetical protein OZ924_10530 [Burkholderiaceae bacterium]|nr:hypothetical protein [Burkholderiaceae bacterium]
MLRGASPYADRFLTGEKTALLTFAVGADRYRVHQDAPWQPRDQAFEHGKTVYSVNHSRMYTTTRGEICSIRALPGRQRVTLQVVEIRMVEVARLTGDEIRALGMTENEFETLYGSWVAGLRGWLIYAIPVAPDSMCH